MDPTTSKFLDIFPEFNSIPSARIEYYLDLAESTVGKKAWGDCYAQAVYLLLAHNLTLMDPSRAGMPTKSSEKVGDISVSYDTDRGEGGDKELNQTQYGKQFLQLRESKIISMNVVCSNDGEKELFSGY